MNISKMYKDISVQSSLGNSVLEDFVKQSDVFFQELKDDIKKLSSYEAIDTLSLLIYAYPYFTSSQEWEMLVACCLESIRDGIYKQKLVSISAYSGLSYICFLIRELVQKLPSLRPFQNSLENLLAATLRSHLDAAHGEYFQLEGNFELINGFSGVLRCCCDEDAQESCRTLADEVAATLVRRLQPKMFMGLAVPGFHYIPSKIEARYMDVPVPNGCVNYSMSHGIAGTLGALSFAYQKQQSADVCEVMKLLIEELCCAQYYINGIAFWPGWISIEQYLGQEELLYSENRMSWCYGSPGILRALYLAADVLSMEDLKHFSTDEMAKIATLDTARYGLNSPIICHGLAGVVLIMRNMYKDTKDNVFNCKAREITDLLVYNFAYRKEQNKALTGPQMIRKYDYLEGYTGVLQTIYSIMTGEANINEERLLLR